MTLKGSIPWNKGKKGVMPTPWNKGLHKDDEKIAEIISKMRKTMRKQYENGRKPWNSGLDKSNPKIAQSGEKASLTKKQKFSKGELVIWNKGKKGVQIPWNKGKKGLQVSTRKGLTKDTSESVRKTAMKITGDWDQLYGKEAAEQRKIKIRKARLKQIFPKSTKIETITRDILLVYCPLNNVKYKLSQI